MFCPKCSQQQASDDIRYCSRCGFQLNVVKALLASDGTPAEGSIQKVSRSFSKRDMSLGALLMFIFAVVVAALTVGLPPFHSAPILFLIIAWLALTLLINIKPIYQYFARSDDGPGPGERATDTPRFSENAGSASLPGSQSIPADMYTPPAVKTGGIQAPISVTEGTTNFLDERR
jgi:hypothetical protein